MVRGAAGAQDVEAQEQEAGVSEGGWVSLSLSCI